MTQLGAAALILGLNVLKMSESRGLPTQGGIVGFWTCCRRHCRSLARAGRTEKRRHPRQYLFHERNDATIHEVQAAFGSLESRLSLSRWLNTYIVSWRQTPPLATVFEATVKDHFGMLSDLDEVILHAQAFWRSSDAVRR